jgi:hypothetical protein
MQLHAAKQFTACRTVKIEKHHSAQTCSNANPDMVPHTQHQNVSANMVYSAIAMPTTALEPQ